MRVFSLLRRRELRVSSLGSFYKDCIIAIRPLTNSHFHFGPTRLAQHFPVQILKSTFRFGIWPVSKIPIGIPQKPTWILSISCSDFKIHIWVSESDIFKLISFLSYPYLFFSFFLSKLKSIALVHSQHHIEPLSSSTRSFAINSCSPTKIEQAGQSCQIQI